MIISAENVALDKNFLFPPNTALSQVMHSWKGHFGVFGNYVFKSEDKKEEYDIDFSLNDIGELKDDSKTVLLNVVLSDLPTPATTRNIYVLCNGRYRHCRVKPFQRLKNIVPNSRGLTFQFNGEDLQVNKTIRQLKLPENAVITVTKSVCVEVSEGSRKAGQARYVKCHVQEGSYACHLKQELRKFEKEDFFLKSKDTILRHDELLDFKQQLDVCRPEYQVSIDEQTYRWNAKGGRMVFEEFAAYLAEESGISRRELLRFLYTCRGCGRRIQKQEQSSQQLNIECCPVRSMNLKVETKSVHESEL